MLDGRYRGCETSAAEEVKSDCCSMRRCAGYQGRCLARRALGRARSSEARMWASRLDRSKDGCDGELRLGLCGGIGRERNTAMIFNDGLALGRALLSRRQRPAAHRRR